MKFKAIGRVYPERAAVSFEPVIWGQPGKLISVSCSFSQIDTFLEHPDVDDLDSAHHSIEHAAHSIVSAVGFLHGCSYSTEITRVFSEVGNSHVYGVQHPEIAFDEKDILSGVKFAGVTRLIEKDIFLRFAISDYTSAITDYTSGPMLCYRALESLAKSVGRTGIDKQDWEAMHKALATKKEEIKSKVGDYAALVRHGNWDKIHNMNHQQRIEMLTFTRDVINDYVELAFSKIQEAEAKTI